MSDPCCDDQFWQDQLTAAKNLVTAYNAAILALATGGAQSYTLETGQSRQVVTKFNLTELKNVRNSLLNEVATLEIRICGTASTHLVPDGAL